MWNNRFWTFFTKQVFSASNKGMLFIGLAGYKLFPVFYFPQKWGHRLKTFRSLETALKMTFWPTKRRNQYFTSALSNQLSRSLIDEIAPAKLNRKKNHGPIFQLSTYLLILFKCVASNLSQKFEFDLNLTQ